MSHTEILSILHDDDLLAKSFPVYVEKVVRFLSKHPNVGMIHENYRVFRAPKSEEEEDSKALGTNYRIYELSTFDITHNGSTKTGIPSCGIILTKTAVKAAGGFNDQYKYIGDQFLSIAMMKKDFRIYQSNILNGYYRLDTNTSAKLDFCQGLVREGVWFRKYWRGTSSFRNAYLRFFESYLYAYDIEMRIGWFSESNPDITVQGLDFLGKYKKIKRYGAKTVLHKLVSLLLIYQKRIISVKI